ncbi:transposase domain-containing protein [Escherichia coli]|nr:transposase domain-containing protein [Escherichia coli]EKC9588435.1 transposase domain-containing protein [Escherichia coli]EKO4248945.1 transposase domain-containing protein [Escherichia coli]HCK1928111.1 transposase domain-containing protein [Escherichia coli]
MPASALRFLLVARKAGTCRLNGIDPEAYLRHILSILPEWPSIPPPCITSGPGSLGSAKVKNTIT